MNGASSRDCELDIDSAPHNSAHVTYANATTFENNLSEGFFVSVKLTRADGIVGFQNYTFNNQTTAFYSCFSGYGYGINTENTFFTVYDENTKFTNLAYWVHVEVGSGQKPFAVSKSHFEKCYIEMYTNGNGNFKVWDNYFDLDDVDSSAAEDCMLNSPVDRVVFFIRKRRSLYSYRWI